MKIELSTLFLISFGYLSMLFGLAYITEKGWISARITQHPVTYVLSLGVCITTWSFYTSIAVANSRGYGYLAYYIGISAAFLLAPIFLRPIMHITRTYQLSSLADLFAFRFRSPWAGTLTTVVLLICIFPLIALQIFAVAASAKILVPEANTNLIALAFCLLMVLFTILFGTSDSSSREKHHGLVVAMAFESIVKLLILSVLGLYAVFAVFGGMNELDQWLLNEYDQANQLKTPFLENSTNLVIVLFFTSAITMPYMFHMVFRENSNPANLGVARWGLPLLLLLVSLPAFPILWAGIFLESNTPAEYYALGIGLVTESPSLTLLAYTGGLAAACGIVIVLALSMSNMCLNHLVLPVHRPSPESNLYQWLLWRRKFLIGAILAMGYFSYLLMADGNNVTVTDVGYISFIASVQFLPGILTLLYWRRANRKGFICGLLAGLVVWFVSGFMSYLAGFSIPQVDPLVAATVNWDLVASISLLSNTLVLVVVSLLSRTTDEEKSAAEMCSRDTIGQPRKMGLIAKTPMEFIDRLAAPLGEANARREVLQALKDLGIDEQESRPYTIQQLLGQIEANLSGLLGPTISQQIIDRFLPYEMISENTTLDISFIESRLEDYPGNLSGVALDLDNLRRHHRQILQDLPLGVCSLGNNNEISLWNSALERLTDIPISSIVGRHITALSDPWKSLLLDFIEDMNSTHVYKKSITVKGKQRWVSLHKAYIEKSSSQKLQHGGLVIVVEDLTETELLEAELTHSERLASIGRLAAGVAHEIGNPITGIACLAQNIRDETVNEELRLMAQQIIEQTNRTSRIVQSLVSFSHSGSRHEEQFKEPVSIHACVEEAIQLISLNQESKDIHFINECDKDVLVHSDKQLLQQIFVNLLTNARDASEPDSSISVTYSINDEHISIMITDEGEGIPEAIQDQIFEPFFTTKDPGKGTGLGLSLVYRITENLGGSIRIISPANKVSRKGTRVIVTFPCYDKKELQQTEPV